MFFFQAGLLILALLYLYWRRFDFSQWQFRISWRASLVGLGLFLLLAGLMDLLYWLVEPGYSDYFAQAQLDLQGGWEYFLSLFSLPTVAYALLNGTYEELYFLGICLAVKKEARVWVWLLSLLVRIGFHTYQGLLAAFGIGLILGIFYYIWYERLDRKNLYPIFLSQAIADVLGLGLLTFSLPKQKRAERLFCVAEMFFCPEVIGRPRSG